MNKFARTIAERIEASLKRRASAVRLYDHIKALPPERNITVTRRNEIIAVGLAKNLVVDLPANYYNLVVKKVLRTPRSEYIET